MKKPNESEGYWVSCCSTPDCAASGKDATFKIQIINGIAYLHCAKCGSFRILKIQSKLHLSGMQS